MHLYSALLCIAVHPKCFTITWDGCHRPMAPVRSPHTCYRWRGERVIEPIKWMGIIRRPCLTRVYTLKVGIWPGHRGYTPTLYEKCPGIFNDHRESGPRFNVSSERLCFLQYSVPVTILGRYPAYPETGDLTVLLSLPIIDANNFYLLKDVVNVGSWQGNTYVKIHTHEVVAYHDNNEQLYLAPNLKMCTLTEDIHFLCPSKLFIRDNTEGICGLESIRSDTSCPAEATPHSQVEATQAEIIGNRWLVNTQHEQLPSHTINTTLPRALICPTKLYGSIYLRARSSILMS